MQSLWAVRVRTEFGLPSSQVGFCALMSHCFLIKLHVTARSNNGFLLVAIALKRHVFEWATIYLFLHEELVLLRKLSKKSHSSIYQYNVFDIE